MPNGVYVGPGQVAFVPDTHYAFTVGKDGLVKYWDADRWELLLTLEGHKAEVHTCSCRPASLPPPCPLHVELKNLQPRIMHCIVVARCTLAIVAVLPLVSGALVVYVSISPKCTGLCMSGRFMAGVLELHHTLGGMTVLLGTSLICNGLLV